MPRLWVTTPPSHLDVPAKTEFFTPLWGCDKTSEHGTWSSYIIHIYSKLWIHVMIPIWHFVILTHWGLAFSQCRALHSFGKSQRSKLLKNYRCSGFFPLWPCIYWIQQASGMLKFYLHLLNRNAGMLQGKLSSLVWKRKSADSAIHSTVFGWILGLGSITTKTRHSWFWCCRARVWPFNYPRHCTHGAFRMRFSIGW